MGRRLIVRNRETRRPSGPPDERLRPRRTAAARWRHRPVAGRPVRRGHQRGARLTNAGLTIFAIRDVAGGITLGLVLGYLRYRALKSIDDHPLELLITLALVVFSIRCRSGLTCRDRSASWRRDCSGRLAMSNRTRQHLDACSRRRLRPGTTANRRNCLRRFSTAPSVKRPRRTGLTFDRPCKRF